MIYVVRPEVIKKRPSIINRKYYTELSLNFEWMDVR